MKHQDYRSILKSEFEARKSRGRELSMNAFAKFIGVTPSHLNDIFSKRRGLSDAKADQISKKLKLSPEEKEFFINSVAHLHARSAAEREKAAECLAKLQRNKLTIIQADVFALVSQWQHFAILELSRLENFNYDPKWIAAKLGIEVRLAADSMKRLESLNLMILKDGSWQAFKGNLRTTSDVPSAAIKSHHHQVLNIAQKALQLQDVHSREFRTTMLAVDKSVVALAKEKIRNFDLEMSELLTSKSTDRTELYCLATQFFSLTLKS